MHIVGRLTEAKAAAASSGCSGQARGGGTGTRDWRLSQHLEHRRRARPNAPLEGADRSYVLLQALQGAAGQRGSVGYCGCCRRGDGEGCSAMPCCAGQTAPPIRLFDATRGTTSAIRCLAPVSRGQTSLK
jgi:hypothetical protein